jgi:hypothetical protein
LLLISEFEVFFAQACLISRQFKGLCVWHSFASAQGQNITQTDTMIHGQADLLLEQGIEVMLYTLYRPCHLSVKITPNKQCPLITFAWNMGQTF